MSDEQTADRIGNGPDRGQIEKAFGLFMEKAALLEASQTRLQLQVERLTNELAQKVREIGELKDHLARVLESVGDAVIATDGDGRLTSMNRAAGELLGRPEERCIERSLEEFGPMGALLAGLARSATAGGERICGREQEIAGADGKRTVLLVSACPLRDARGQLVGAVLSAQDVSQLRELERAVARKERLSALGEMASVLAHEIRNPLGGIQLYAGVLGRSAGLTAEELEVVRKLSKGINGLNKLVEDMLAFAREIVANRVRQDVRLAVEGALDLAAAEIEAKSVIVARKGWARPLEVPIDADLIRRAFLNLILNAVDAVEDGGRLELAARFEHSGGRRWMVLSVSDDGNGIPPENTDKVLNPFFTTKAKGTGLGLAVVSTIVTAHGGDMRVERNGRLGGASIVVRLPAE